MPSEERNKLQKKKVLILCPHPVGYAPGQRLKYEQYFDIFRKNNFDITVSAFMSEDFQMIVYKKGRIFEKMFWTLWGYGKRIRDLFRVRKFDIVYVFLWVGPFAPPVLEYLTRILAKKLVYDIDDLVFLNPPSSANPLVHYLRSPRNHIFLMKKADHVITCTPYLDQFVRKYNLNTTDISSTVDTFSYKAKTDYGLPNIPVLGWSGSHSTSKYLHLLDGVLQKLAKKREFKLVVMGDAGFSIEGVNVEAIPWTEQAELKVISSFDIGLYPLPDEQWVYGKSGLKAIQYMAMGIPTVAAAIGTNFRVIEDKVSGFLVQSDEEWLQALECLLNDQELRHCIGTHARKRVEELFSIEANKEKYLSVLNTVLNKKPKTKVKTNTSYAAEKTCKG